jgi:hypothetical protein
MSNKNIHVPDDAEKSHEFRIETFYCKRTRAKHYLVFFIPENGKESTLEGFLHWKHVLQYLERKMK